MRTTSYYNTTGETGKTLRQSEKKAKTQESEILAFFQKSRGKFTPEQIHEILFKDRSVPLTSVRRAVSNLTAAGKLQKTDMQRVGSYGKLVHVWELRQRRAEQLSLFN